MPRVGRTAIALLLISSAQACTVGLWAAAVEPRVRWLESDHESRFVAHELLAAPDSDQIRVWARLEPSPPPEASHQDRWMAIAPLFPVPPKASVLEWVLRGDRGLTLDGAVLATLERSDATERWFRADWQLAGTYDPTSAQVSSEDAEKIVAALGAAPLGGEFDAKFSLVAAWDEEPPAKARPIWTASPEEAPLLFSHVYRTLESEVYTDWKMIGLAAVATPITLVVDAVVAPLTLALVIAANGNDDEG